MPALSMLKIRGMVSLLIRGLILAGTLTLTALATPRLAAAQYRNNLLSFEAGYSFIEDDFGLDSNALTFGLRTGYKATDHWWFSTRLLLSFRGDNLPVARTNILFHLTPLDVRYYFETDGFRPYVGGAIALHFLANSGLASTVQSGLGPIAGVEFKLRRDLFLGFQADGLYLFAFDGEDVEAFNLTTQLIFFL